MDHPSEFLEHLPGIAGIQDASGRYVWISAATPAGWLGKLDIEVQPPHLCSAIIANHDAFLRGSTTTSEEVRVLGADEVRFRVHRFAVSDDRVAFHGVDVSEDHEAAARRAVADRLASVAAISAGIAHEINNPLSWVLGNLDFAQREVENWRGTPSTESVRDVRESVVEALDGANRMRRVIRELRTFSHREPANDLVDLRRVITSAVQVTGRDVRASAELTTELGRAPMVRADASLLVQVLVNLLGNAAEAFDRRRRGIVKVTLGTSPTGDALLEVIDNGSGIPADELESIFYPFFTTKAGGTGLGLAICQHVIHSFGGAISVHSELGDGTRFVIQLPAGRKPTLVNPKITGQFARSDTSVLARQPGTLNLMIIDDEPFIGSLLQRMLDEHQVAVFQTGREALENLRIGGDYDVILCDLMMQEMSGMQVYAAIREEFPAMAKRVVFMTGGAYTPDAQEFLDAAENTCIPKPFDIRVLRSTIQRVASTR